MVNPGSGREGLMVYSDNTFLAMKCDIFRNLVPFVQFKKRETLLKVTCLHGCFSRFLNCTNDTKSCKASLINPFQYQQNYYFTFPTKKDFAHFFNMSASV